MIQAILFDLDNTLIDRSEAVKRFARQVWSRQLTGSTLAQNQFVTKIAQLDGNGYVPRIDFFKSLVVEFKLSQDQIDAIETSFYHSAWTQPVVIPGTIEALKKIASRGIKIGIITNGRHEAQSQKLIHSGFNHLIDATLISESFGVKKPDPAIFNAACESLNIQANRSWFVGDHPVNDVWASKQVGFKSAWVQRDYTWPEEYAPCYDIKADTLQEVLDKLMA